MTERPSFLNCCAVMQVRNHLSAAGAAASPTEPALKPLINRMLTEFNFRFGDGSVENIPVKMALASALDPRSKHLGWLSESDQTLVWDELTAYLINLMDELDAAAAAAAGAAVAAAEREAKAQQAATSSSASTTSSARADQEERDDDSTDMFAGLALFTSAPLAVTNATTVKDQLKQYRGLPDLKHSEKKPGNPLLWWQHNEHRAPIVAQGARRLLCIPATSASSERVFSTAGQVVDDKRTALKPENAGRLVFLKGSWEAVSKATATAAAAQHSVCTASVTTAGPQQSSSVASSQASSATVRSASAAEKVAKLDFSAGNLKEGRHASLWSTGGTGRGIGVPKRGMRPISAIDHKPDRLNMNMSPLSHTCLLTGRRTRSMCVLITCLLLLRCARLSHLSTSRCVPSVWFHEAGRGGRGAGKAAAAKKTTVSKVSKQKRRDKPLFQSPSSSSTSSKANAGDETSTDNAIDVSSDIASATDATTVTTSSKQQSAPRKTRQTTATATDSTATVKAVQQPTTQSKQASEPEVDRMDQSADDYDSYDDEEEAEESADELPPGETEYRP